ncbi:ArdC-like ssDNA-binding domain-containing protein [Heyndrickxia sporothermodurans]|uniref:ArdC family protein n=1 Tax=Heyndrickxia sporothermodurans TaxID=46224 RepID=UPI002DBDB5F4|nr:ArdC family protein [Heyndrickxia sporothermodurans]MEB6550193.1 ArdC-like ssDNA-binding domain-containing protein [Heyndrickxia sporothermodurans]
MAAGSNFLTLDDVNKQLDKGLEDILKSERFKELLDVMSKVNNYSINNSILIAMQKPDATMVQGFNAWKDMGRYVQKGEKALKVLAPLIKKVEMEHIDPKTQKPKIDEKGNIVTSEQKVITGFKMVPVYDVSQTDGKEIPSVRDFINREMSNDEHIKRLYDDFFDHIKQSYPIREDVTDKGVGGYFRPSTNEIVISNTENNNDSMKFRVLIHEYAHAKLHNLESDMKDLPRGHKEAQAESVAYIVSKYYGLDTDDISLGYIATWSQDINVARSAIGEVQKVANEMILTIDELQRDKIQEFYIDNNKEYNQSVELLKNQFNIHVESIDKTGKEINQFELLNKDNGMVVSAKLDYSEKTEKFQLRTDRNWIIPLSELNLSGNYHILNKEIVNGIMVDKTEQKKLQDTLDISKNDNDKYSVVISGSTQAVSKEFTSKEDVDKHFLKLALSQSLHEQSFLKGQLKNEPNNTDIKERLENNNLQINYDVAKYLNYNSDNQIIPKGEDGSKIGWALMKNRDITDLKGLEEYLDKTKNMPSQKGLREAFNNSYEVQHDKNVKETKKETFEIER